MKVLNIVRYLPIKGFPAENDITFKIYNDLRKEHQIKSRFVMPLSYLPRWSTYLKRTIKNRYEIINNFYKDENYKFQVDFFQAYFPLKLVKSVKVNYYNPIFQFNIFKNKLFSIFTKYQPNIIHAHTLSDGFYAYQLSKKYHCPYILTLRGQYSELYNFKISKNILNGAKYLVTPSYQLYKDLKKEYAIELMPHGLETSWYLESEKEFDSTTIRLVTTSRLLEMKNIQIVLQSLMQLKNEGFKIKYHIIGDGPYKNKLKALVVKYSLNNEVIFYGHQTQEKIKKIYKKSDIFIMLSTSETFGRVYFEAAAQGLLVIGTKDTGADGYFSKEEAFFIEPNSLETIKILKCINKTLIDKMTIKSRKKVVGFKNEIIVKRYNNILENALSNHSVYSK